MENGLRRGHPGIVAVANFKSKVGKSTVVTSLAHSLGLAGFKILVIDLDMQGNTTGVLGGERYMDNTLDCLLIDQHVHFTECIYPTSYENVSLVPNNISTSWVEENLYKMMPSCYSLLSNKLKDYEFGKFDFILLDCPSSFGVFVFQALMAASFIIIPVSGSTIKFLNFFMLPVMAIERWVFNNKKHKTTFKILVNNVDKRTGMFKEIQNNLLRQFGQDMIFKTYIGASDSFGQAEWSGETIVRNSASSWGARNYREFMKEFLIEFSKANVERDTE